MIKGGFILADAQRAPVDQLAKAFLSATPEERKALQPILMHRAALTYKRLPLDRAQQLRASVESALRSSPRSQPGVAVRAIAGVQ